MSDITDEATEIEIMWTAHSIKQAQSAYEPKPITDQCLYCGEPTQDKDSSFCSYGPDSCATDYQRASEIKRKQGVSGW